MAGLTERGSGILLHPTSLPSEFGIGDLGPGARQFVDLLVAAGQTWWQMLPLGPTGYGNSPYMSFSALAGNPMLISPTDLAADRLLTQEEIAAPPPFPKDHVDYQRVIDYKDGLLRRAHVRFLAEQQLTPSRAFATFCERNAFWLEDYVLFRALKTAHGERTWMEWEPNAARRDPEALVEWRTRLGGELQFGKFLEYQFHRQWEALRTYCRSRNVRIIGDLPIYVAQDSAEVWSNRDLFLLDRETGAPLAVAGVPPDYFSSTGQLWGNPLYRWDEMAHRGYGWWTARFRAAFQLVDLLRIDHFRGFEAFWEVPSSATTATNGQWVPGPGAPFFEAMQRSVPGFSVIAEDLGVITPQVDALRDQFGFPGMRILQMAFGDDQKASDYLPHNHVQNSVVYTATHDHNTTLGWFTAPAGTETTQTEQQVSAERTAALEYVGTDGTEIHWDFIRMAMASPANLCIFPLQDALGLDSRFRMNRPGTLSGNWAWRFTEGQLSSTVIERLASYARIYERIPRP